MGISFAIPIEVAMKVVDQLKTNGHVTRGWLGVQIQDVTRELAESFGMKKPQGALISKVLPKSPAEAAGLQIGDVITDYNKQEIVSSSALPPMVGNTKIGDNATLTVIRQGQTKEIQVKIGNLPDEDEIIAAAPDAGSKEVDRLGLNVSGITADQREQLEIKQNGVLVQDVKPGPAMEAGIRRGDVILRIQDQVIKDVKQFNDVVQGLPKGKAIRMLVQRRGGSQFLALKLKE